LEKNNNISEIELLLRHICFNIKKEGRAILGNFDITPPQFNALQLLIDCGPLTIGELSNVLYLAPSTITDLVDRMEKSHLVIRERSTEDRRIVKVKAEEKAHILIEEVIKLRCDYINRLLTELSPKEIEDFMHYLKILNSGQ